MKGLSSAGALTTKDSEGDGNEVKRKIAQK